MMLGLEEAVTSPRLTVATATSPGDRDYQARQAGST